MSELPHTIVSAVERNLQSPTVGGGQFHYERLAGHMHVSEIQSCQRLDIYGKNKRIGYPLSLTVLLFPIDKTGRQMTK